MSTITAPRALPLCRRKGAIVATLLIWAPTGSHASVAPIGVNQSPPQRPGRPGRVHVAEAVGILGSSGGVPRLSLWLENSSVVSVGRCC
jgi:hypothetical protein